MMGIAWADVVISLIIGISGVVHVPYTEFQYQEGGCLYQKSLRVLVTVILYFSYFSYC